MAIEGRYVSNEERFIPYAFAALHSRFSDRAAFDNFYFSLSSPDKKDEFLRVTSFYLFLVKQGDWHVSIEGSDEVIEYLTNSFKVVALFSLIESLSDSAHQDFHQWLRIQNVATTFPIESPEALRKLHDRYKSTFGSIRRCVTFFGRLPTEQQESLARGVQVGGTPIESIKKLAQYLYDLRSKFVHEANLVLQVSNSSIISSSKKGIVHTDLPLTVLLEAFEEGVLAYFKNGT